MKPICLIVFIFCSVLSVAQEPATRLVSNSTITEANVSDNHVADLSILPTATEVQLDWVIGDDAFKGYCIVEKSLDGKKWKNIGIAFSGESTVNEYRYFDKNLTDTSTTYYRVRRITESGKELLSKVQTLDMTSYSGSFKAN